MDSTPTLFLPEKLLANPGCAARVLMDGTPTLVPRNQLVTHPVSAAGHGVGGTAMDAAMGHDAHQVGAAKSPGPFPPVQGQQPSGLEQARTSVSS